jgi:hypothetical protein
MKSLACGAFVLRDRRHTTAAATRAFAPPLIGVETSA